ncbi:hypothetical protein Nepgr_003898 [Nepenthes gracilis]|uniref:Uncharacterized protein n=1 Tax=Nepenthes gracilis TaxID=150966 RepID=A0AAD3S0H3_NEPGR|nr:hypothetical protein Nepgr_003898 [Nepenthes gracilis]
MNTPDSKPAKNSIAGASSISWSSVVKKDSFGGSPTLPPDQSYSEVYRPTRRILTETNPSSSHGRDSKVPTSVSPVKNILGTNDLPSSLQGAGEFGALEGCPMYGNNDLPSILGNLYSSSNVTLTLRDEHGLAVKCSNSFDALQPGEDFIQPPTVGEEPTPGEMKSKEVVWRGGTWHDLEKVQSLIKQLNPQGSSDGAPCSWLCSPKLAMTTGKNRVDCDLSAIAREKPHVLSQGHTAQQQLASFTSNLASCTLTMPQIHPNVLVKSDDNSDSL